MGKISCIVVDDEKTAREGIAHYVGQVPYLSLIGQCKSAIELDAVLLEEEVDLVLLDINMPGLSGLEWLKHAQKPPMVIFTTAHREYALDGYDLNVIDYLLKPISFARFSQATLKAYQQVQSKTRPTSSSADTDRYIFIKEDQQTIKIFLKDILYFEAAVDYIYIHTSEKRYMTLFSMKQVEQEVAGLSFLRIHRSYIINTQKVKMIKGHQVVMGDDELPISRKLFQQVYEQLVSNTLWKE
ncbi:MAG: LytTR family DNA-binding domain-containing protein [Reichenbachiella sp.]